MYSEFNGHEFETQEETEERIKLHEILDNKIEKRRMKENMIFKEFIRNWNAYRVFMNVPMAALKSIRTDINIETRKFRPWAEADGGNEEEQKELIKKTNQQITAAKI